MSKIHLVIPDQHAHPDYDNTRADLLAHLINDLKPDVVVNLGDAADMPSMCSYDKGLKSFHGRNYEKDIDSHLEFQDRMWKPVFKKKKKLPRRVIIEGNHEHRIKRAINLQPELEGEKFGVSFRDLDFGKYYQDVVEYNGATPGIIDIDNIIYSHYLVSGVKGLPISGEHTAYSLISKHFQSCTVGHIHTADWSTRTRVDGTRIHGLAAGVFQDWDAGFAGEGNKLWWRGVVIKRNVDNGNYDPEFVSLDRLRKEYT